jgi:Rad3-related DNA helicase/REP element-mobilizing transposase RayT
MASSVERAFEEGHHLMVEAGTGVGKSFAYLLPAIDYAVKRKKRVVVSTHTISLQEQLIEKDIPLLQSVYPDEFTAVLVKGRNNYLCQRRLQQARGRQAYLFEQERQLESLWMIEEWAQESLEKGGMGSLAEMPKVPEPEVWDKVCAEHGNCLGKKCPFYNNCFWQGAKRRMQSGNVLVVNHALFFSDLALRMVGVNYLPKYDVVVLDEAHTVEDVAGQHFGLKLTEAGLRYTLRNLYDAKKGRGTLSVHGSKANDAIRDIIDLNEIAEGFFERCVTWQENYGRGNGRIREKEIVENDLSPKLRDLSLHVKAMLVDIENDEEVSELTAVSAKISAMAETADAILGQKMDDAVYWMDIAGRTPKRVSLHAAPIDVGEGLRRELFGKLPSVVMCSATLCTSGETKGAVLPRRGGVSPPSSAVSPLLIREGKHLPHWTQNKAIYAVTFRLADSLPESAATALRSERDTIVAAAREQGRPLSTVEVARLRELHTRKVDALLDNARGECWLRRPDIGELVADAVQYFDGERYRLLAWCVMPNHVHAVVQPVGAYDLDSVLHSWKSFTAHAINKKLEREGEVWQDESYDHLIRDSQDLLHAVEYLWANPENAGLQGWTLRGRNDDLIEEFSEEVSKEKDRGRDAPATRQDAALEEGRDPGFDYARRRLGLDACVTVRLGSPFDYEKQATLYVETGLPEPSDPRFMAAACEKVVKYLKQTHGGAFVLFTSYKMLIDCANRLKAELDDLGLPILVQGQGAPRKILLDRFRSTPDAVLFGTSSFWQGIDVQGEALRNVIIVKLPFAVPDEPVTEARLDAITRAGGNAFMDYSVPEAIIKLKQGFGRLIRSKTDKGIVVVLDSRVKTKRYGKLFLEALPQCRLVEVGK